MWFPECYVQLLWFILLHSIFFILTFRFIFSFMQSYFSIFQVYFNILNLFLCFKHRYFVANVINCWRCKKRFFQIDLLVSFKINNLAVFHTKYILFFSLIYFSFIPNFHFCYFSSFGFWSGCSLFCRGDLITTPSLPHPHYNTQIGTASWTESV